MPLALAANGVRGSARSRQCALRSQRPARKIRSASASGKNAWTLRFVAEDSKGEGAVAPLALGTLTARPKVVFK
jgi:hypothetical protein